VGKKDDSEPTEAPKLAEPVATIATRDFGSENSSEETTPKATPAKSLTWIQALHQGDDKAFEKDLTKELGDIIARHQNLSNYEILFLFDDDSIVPYHSDRLYSAARTLKGKGKDILLIIDSPGGRIEPAYLISKTLKRIASNKFSVAVPRRAKSAATLISLGAEMR
jgi:ClpP class serine protease